MGSCSSPSAARATSRWWATSTGWATTSWRCTGRARASGSWRATRVCSRRSAARATSRCRCGTTTARARTCWRCSARARGSGSWRGRASGISFGGAGRRPDAAVQLLRHGSRRAGGVPSEHEPVVRGGPGQRDQLRRRRRHRRWRRTSTGSGRDEIGVYRPSTGQWFVGGPRRRVRDVRRPGGHPAVGAVRVPEPARE